MRNKIYHCDAEGVITESYYGERPTPKPEPSRGDIISQLEAQTGQRWDHNGGDNRTMNSLLGMMSRALGKNPHGEDMDEIVGMVIRHDISPAGQAERDANEALASLLVSGVAPDTIFQTAQIFKKEP